MNNQQFAVRQRLHDVYTGELARISERIEVEWLKRAALLAESVSDKGPGQRFAELVRSGSCDSLLVNDAQGHLLYPVLPRPPADASEVEADEWLAARRLEHEQGDATAAAEAYAALFSKARQAEDVNLEARALMAQARCLARVGDRQKAVEILVKTLADAQRPETFPGGATPGVGRRPWGDGHGRSRGYGC